MLGFHDEPVPDGDEELRLNEDISCVDSVLETGVPTVEVSSWDLV